ncbi:MAG: gliding motility-associated C-terminal domain-containing protein [Bacteroidia bacterium]
MSAYRTLIFLAFVIILPRYVWAQIDTIACGDTLQASFTVGSPNTPTDSFYVWLGNCQPVVKFDFHTLDVPDGADMFYVDINGNKTSAGSIPYFGGNCTSNNYFTNPTQFPIYSALNPQACLPGFVELYGAGIPMHDSIVHRTTKPADFKLNGPWQECARLHLNIPFGTVAVLFVIKFNPTQTTILNALWDCSPDCCIIAEGDTVCAGQNAQLGTDREAFGYTWTGPNGFISNLREPIITNATAADEGWYYLEGSYLFGCNGYDSVYVQVHAPDAVIQPDTSQICFGTNAQLQAVGNLNYQWIQTTPGMVSVSGNMATVSPSSTMSYTVIGTDTYGCSDTSSAVVIPSELTIQVNGSDVSCFGQNDGQISVNILYGQAPFQIRQSGGNWLQGTTLNGLLAGNYQIEVMDAAGCMANGQISINEPTAISATIHTLSATCKDSCNGEINITPLGGVTPYLFEANGQTISANSQGLCPGNFNITISDANGCTFNSSTTINEPAALSATVNAIPATCNNICNGEINISPTGGTAPYQYISDGQTINASASGLCAGTFNLIIQDANGCSFETDYTIEEPEELSTSIDVGGINCKDKCNGSISLSPSGGIAPYQFTSNGQSIEAFATELCAGTYSLIVEDANGCTFQTSAIIEEPEELSASIGTMPPSCEGFCNGEINIFPMGGTAPYQFETNGQIIDAEAGGFCAGVYELLVSDASGCTFETSYVIDEPEPFKIDLGRNRTIVKGDSITLKINSNSIIESVEWPGLCDLDCHEEIVITPDSSFIVSATATSIMGCKASDQMILSVKKKAECGEGIYAPNAFTPNGDGFNERFTIYADQGDTDIRQIGRLVIFNQWGKIVFDVSSIPPGVAEYGWDGYSLGKAVPEGNYTWAATFIRDDGASFQCGGNILVIR